MGPIGSITEGGIAVITADTAATAAIPTLSGLLTTVHANSAVDALSRLETLASMSDVALPVETVLSAPAPAPG